MKGKIFPFFFLFLLFYSITVVAQALSPVSFSTPYASLNLNATTTYTGPDANMTVLWFVNNIPARIDHSSWVDNNTPLTYTLPNTYFIEDDLIRIIINATTGTNQTGIIKIRGETEMIAFIIIALILAFLFLGLFIWQEAPVFGIISAVLFLICGFLFFTTSFAGIQDMFKNGLGIICWAVFLLLLLTSYKVSQ